MAEAMVGRRRPQMFNDAAAAQRVYEQELGVAVDVVAARHGPWCGDLKEWVDLIHETRSDLATHLALKGAGLI